MSLRQHPAVLTEVLDGEAVLLCPDRVQHRLDPVATVVWLELAVPRDLPDLVEDLVTRSGAPRQQVQGDVTRLVDELSAAGLLQEA